jgi:ankyrin repeat protein
MTAPVPPRVLPARANLAQQKTQSRELLQAFSRNDADAVARVRAMLPDKPRIVLADAQFVLAREYGFANWPAFRRHLEEREAALRAPHERLHTAMMRGDAPTARALFAAHPEFRPMLNAPVFSFNAPALVACAGNADLVEVLLENGADPNARSAWWAGPFHPLHVASGRAAELLLAAGATPDLCAAAHLDDVALMAAMLAQDPTRVHERGGDGQTPLHFARSRAAVDLLLDAGADIDARDVDHRATPAQWMLDRRRDAGRYALAQYLAERGATCDIFLAAALGRTADAVALLERDPALLDAHTSRGGYAAQPPSSDHIYTWGIGAHRAPLDVAAQFGHDETVAAMLRHATPTQQLWLACRRGDTDAALALASANPSLVASLTRADHRAVTDAAWNGDAAAVTTMLAIGLDPATPGQDGGTALHCAAWQGSADTVAVLLQHPSAAMLLTTLDTSHGQPPLGWCCHGSLNGPRHGAYAQVARLLLEAGATPTPFDAADDVEAVIAAWC